MKTFTLITFVCICALTTKAQFSGDYATGNWTTTTAFPSNGTINTAGAPGSIIVNGSNGGGPGAADTDFTIVAIASGAWSFDWNYQSNDEAPNFDPAFVLINGVATQLSDNGGSQNQSNTYVGIAAINDVIGFRVRATDNGGGNATLTISSFAAPGGVLPIKLSSFNARAAGKQIQLDWATASETNNDRFEIERSADGKKFEKIGTVKSSGNSDQIQQYSFNDIAPLNNNNYYRLHQIDKDDASAYSKIAMVKFETAARITAYPNPAKEVITINIGTVSTSQKENISLFSIQGKLLESRKVSLQTAVNNTVQWNVSGLASGQYYFKIGNAATPVPFIKE